MATAVTITGQGFITTAGATTFKFGGVAATGVVCASTTTCTATTPAGSGIVDVSRERDRARDAVPGDERHAHRRLHLHHRGRADA